MSRKNNNRAQFIFQVLTEGSEDSPVLFAVPREALKYVVGLAGRWDNIRQIKLLDSHGESSESLPIPGTIMERREFYDRYSELLSTTRLSLITLRFLIDNPGKLGESRIFKVQQTILIV